MHIHTFQQGSKFDIQFLYRFVEKISASTHINRMNDDQVMNLMQYHGL